MNDTVDVLAITAKNSTGKLLPYKELIQCHVMLRS